MSSMYVCHLEASTHGGKGYLCILTRTWILIMVLWLLVNVSYTLGLVESIMDNTWID